MTEPPPVLTTSCELPPAVCRSQSFISINVFPPYESNLPYNLPTRLASVK